MSADQLRQVMDLVATNEAFSRQLVHDLEGTLKANGYDLSPSEIATLRATFSPSSRAPQPPGQAGPPVSSVDMINDMIRNQQAQSRVRAQAQSDRLIELGNATLDIFKNTLKYSARTYRMVTLMNSVMFWMGVSLFGFAALYGAFTQNLIYTGVFCGLGAASFISLFFLGPIDKTQVALSNLIQAEIAFMSYFEQIGFCENYAMLPPPNSGKPTHECIEKASELLQKRSRETVELLKIYLGKDPELTKPLAAQQAAEEKLVDAAEEAGAGKVQASATG